MTEHQSTTLYSWWEPVAVGLSKLPPCIALMFYEIFHGTCKVLLNITSCCLEFLQCIVSFCMKAFELCVVSVVAYIWKHMLDLVVSSHRSLLVNHMEKNWVRKSQESTDREIAWEVVERFVAESGGLYMGVEQLPDIGSRLQKYWFRSFRCGGDNVEVIITVTKVSANCPVDLEKDMATLTNKLFPDIKGLYIQPILEVKHFPAQQQLLVVQPFHSQGSLKDFIYNKAPVNDWSHKYCQFTTSPPPPHMVAKYGRQILEAILFLYDHGFHQLGHVQSGNILLEGDHCCLGGFENSVFGYKTRLTTLLSGNMESMDLLMFGHLIFEMACGYELTTLVPTPEDLQRVNDSSLLDVLYLIFQQDRHGRFTSTLDKLLRHRFFQSQGTDTRTWMTVHLARASIDRDVKSLLTKVKKGKSRQRKHSSRDNKCKLQ